MFEVISFSNGNIFNTVFLLLFRMQKRFILFIFKYMWHKGNTTQIITNQIN